MKLLKKNNWSALTWHTSLQYQTLRQTEQNNFAWFPHLAHLFFSCFCDLKCDLRLLIKHLLFRSNSSIINLGSMWGSMLWGRDGVCVPTDAMSHWGGMWESTPWWRDGVWVPTDAMSIWRGMRKLTLSWRDGVCVPTDAMSNWVGKRGLTPLWTDDVCVPTDNMSLSIARAFFSPLTWGLFRCTTRVIGVGADGRAWLVTAILSLSPRCWTFGSWVGKARWASGKPGWTHSTDKFGLAFDSEVVEVGGITVAEGSTALWETSVCNTNGYSILGLRTIKIIFR